MGVAVGVGLGVGVFAGGVGVAVQSGVFVAVGTETGTLHEHTSSAARKRVTARTVESLKLNLMNKKPSHFGRE